MRTSLAVVCLALFSAACSNNEEQGRATAGGDAQKGKAYLSSYGCGSCHTIPGVRAARGQVGPPLAGLGNRVFVAGKLPNQTENLMRWIKDPHSVDEKTAMPNLGVTDEAARDIAAYLYTLK